jgi:hypothetical protein
VSEASHWCRGAGRGQVCSQAFWPVVFGGGWCGRGFQLLPFACCTEILCRGCLRPHRPSRRVNTCLGVLCCSAAFRSTPSCGLGRALQRMPPVLRGPAVPASVQTGACWVGDDEDVGAPARCCGRSVSAVPCHVGGGGQTHNRGHRGAEFRQQFQQFVVGIPPLSLALAGSGLWPLPRRCALRHEGPADTRLCAAAVGGGRRLMRLPAPVWVDSGPKRRIDRVGAQ